MSNIFRFAILVIISISSISTYAATNELAPRRGQSPSTKAKINSILAENWGRKGLDGSEYSNDDDYIQESQSDNKFGGSRNCTTNIGVVKEQRGISSGRYGPKNNKDNRPIVIKGDVISLCK